MSPKKTFAALAAACLCVLSPAALAVVVLQAANVTVDPALGTFAGYPAASMINQDGLTGGARYTSGVTDYAPYVASTPNHTAAVAAGNTWRSDPNEGITGYLDFDLGGVFTLTNIALWSGSPVNLGFGSLQSFDVWLNGGLVDKFNVANQFTPLYAQSFALSVPTKVSQVRLVLTSSYDARAVSISEVAFGVGSVSVAEPFTVSLLAFGLVGFGLRNKPLLQRA